MLSDTHGALKACWATHTGHSRHAERHTLGTQGMLSDTHWALKAC